MRRNMRITWKFLQKFSLERTRSLLMSTRPIHVLDDNVVKMSTISPPPECLFKPMNFPHKVLMGPGPSNCPPRVLGANALPLLGHLHPEFTLIMDEVKAGIKYIFQTNNEWTVCVSGSGHAAMETACLNLLEPGDTALVGINGLWGERFADMVDRQGIDVKKLQRPMGEVFTHDEIEEALKKHKPALLFLTHGESSGSTLQPLEGVGTLCHKYNCLLLVDSVAACGGVPMFMDKWGIDCLYTGAQKVLSSPPGASPISFSERAKEKIKKRATRVRSFNFDMNHLANYWGCDGEARRYHHTGPISNIYAIREGLARLAEQGLEESWKMHKQCAELLHEGLEKIGLELLVKNKSIRNPCVTAVKVPDGVDWKAVTEYAMKTYRVEIAGGLGALAGKIWRIGVMGYNCTPDNIRLVLRALEEGLKMTGYSKL
ncbi:hypothetical protein ACJMK2_007367 [Sinanodonta woodiana]|uniref:Alanine--glyoxylate aminotransferase n=1 Tax=Sinanodonta woodiana TaxID=1069815 RepID=A0ABD3VJG0_SINWO